MLFSILTKIIEIFVIIVFLSLFRTYIHCIPSPYDNSFLHKAFQFLSPKPRSRPEQVQNIGQDHSISKSQVKVRVFKTYVKARACQNLGQGQIKSIPRSRPERVQNLGQDQSKFKTKVKTRAQPKARSRPEYSKLRSRPEHVKTQVKARSSQNLGQGQSMSKPRSRSDQVQTQVKARAFKTQVKASVCPNLGQGQSMSKPRLRPELSKSMSNSEHVQVKARSC